jgi:hypothetical protein
MKSGWLMYEAGGIAAAVDSTRVCTVCVGIDPRDIVSPLNFFQATKLERDDVYRLIKMLNTKCVPSLDPTRLEKSFSKAWPDLEAALVAVVAMKDQEPPKRSTDPVGSALERILDGQSRLEARLGSLERKAPLAAMGPVDLPSTGLVNALANYGKRTPAEELEAIRMFNWATNAEQSNEVKTMLSNAMAAAESKNLFAAPKSDKKGKT